VSALPDSALANDKAKAERANARRTAKREKAEEDDEKRRKRAAAARDRRSAPPPAPSVAKPESSKKASGSTLSDALKRLPSKTTTRHRGSPVQPQSSARQQQNCTTRVVLGVSLKTCSGSSSS